VRSILVSPGYQSNSALNLFVNAGINGYVTRSSTVPAATAGIQLDFDARVDGTGSGNGGSIVQVATLTQTPAHALYLSFSENKGLLDWTTSGFYGTATGVVSVVASGQPKGAWQHLRVRVASNWAKQTVTLGGGSELPYATMPITADMLSVVVGIGSGGTLGPWDIKIDNLLLRAWAP
jgi:hypothetical protein